MPYVLTRHAESVAGTSAAHNVVLANTSKTQDLAAHELLDNGAGSFGPWGTINYVGKSFTVRLAAQDSRTDSYTSDYEDAKVFQDLSVFGNGPSGGGGSESAKGGTYTSAAVSEQLLAGGTVQVSYSMGFGGAESHTQSFAPPVLSIDLCPLSSDYVVPGSVQFTWMGHVYRDFEGQIYRDRTDTQPGVLSGTMDYTSGIAQLTDWVVNGDPEAFTLDSLWTRRQAWKTATIMMRTQAAPLAPGGFVMVLTDTAGNQLTATVDPDGYLTGDHMLGRMDLLSGVAELQFGDLVLDATLTPAQKAQWWYNAADVGAVAPDKIWRPWPVDPTTLRYNSVAYYYLPIDADILGLDPVRLPPDGKVPIFRKGSYVVVGHTGTLGPVTVTAGQTIDTGRERLSRVRLLGSDNQVIHTGYTADLDAGTISIVDPTGWAQPVRPQHRIEDLVRVSDVQIDGTLTFTRQLSHDFPLGSYVSTALMTNTLRARVSVLFDQKTWNGTWSDTLVGEDAAAAYQDGVAPIEVTNAGTLTERWFLRFTSSNNFELVGEHVGVIASGNIDTDFAPVNPISGVPYMVIRKIGWSGGWAQGNVLRINTVGAMYPFAVIRTVQQGPSAGTDYAFELLGRGDVNREPTTP